MRLDASLLETVRVAPGAPAALGRRETAGTRLLDHRMADHHLQDFVAELAAAQQLLYAADTAAVLLVLQGMDASGKDGTVKHVMSGVNPQGCAVTSFKQPSAEELAHTFLWRVAARVPERGRIGIFNRSHYEDVVVTRVHPELLSARPGSDPSGRLWEKRYEDINAFEHHLHRNGTRIVKVFLHISKKEQRQRLLARLDDPTKQWKFSPSDVAERAFWDQYQSAYEHAITATSTRWAPWHVVPGDDKHVARALVAGILVDAIDGLHLQQPTVSDEQRAELDRARQELQAD